MTKVYFLMGQKQDSYHINQKQAILFLVGFIAFSL